MATKYDFCKDVWEKDLAVIITNCVLNFGHLKKVWSKACVKICADGGANALYATCVPREDYIPTFIVGDLDSVSCNVLQWYESKGTQIVKISCQHKNDLEKCLELLGDNSLLKECLCGKKGHWDRAEALYYERKTCIPVVFCGLNGRLDHLLGILNVLTSEKANEKIYAIAENNIVIPLKKGTSEIKNDSRLEGPHCGIVPLQSKVVITTSGLVWNLASDELEFGVFISTSNLISENLVKIETSGNVLWTAELKDFPSSA